MLELNELVKHYPTTAGGEPVRAVNGVSMTVSPGELVALYGPSGSGKTTLLLMVAGLLRADSGSVALDGREISRLSAKESALYRRLEIGFVRQSFDLIPGARAIENASLKLWLTGASERQVRARVQPLLERLGLSERMGHRPDQLSMGERQRVMIARALSTKPKLLLADEPTGSLDTRRGREVLELLSEVCRERQLAVLLVTHDPQVAAFADQVHELCDGRLIAYRPDRAAMTLARS